jgi:hypothetical protein
MNRTDIDKSLHIRPWKPALEMVPHLTIETNMTCNFRCRTCYNHNRQYVKPLASIKEEIDLGLKLRKADTITLLGGEPTMHPELTGVIRYIKKKGVVAQMLTNGFILLGEHGITLLQQLKDSGLDRILLHIDGGQNAYPDPVASIHTFLKMTSSIGLLTSLSWTIYPETQGRVPDLIREFSQYPHFDGLLCVIEKDVDRAIQPGYRKNGHATMQKEYVALQRSLQLQPSEYLPSSLDDADVKWLIYLYYLNASTMETFFVSPRLTRLYRKLYLRVRQQELFGVPPMRRAPALTVVMLGLIECLISPGRTKSFMRLLKKSGWTRMIRYQYMGIQDVPEFDNDKGGLALCYHCPDATVRNGKITPVCLADRISPLPGSRVPDDTPTGIRELVYNHLAQ